MTGRSAGICLAPVVLTPVGSQRPRDRYGPRGDGWLDWRSPAALRDGRSPSPRCHQRGYGRGSRQPSWRRHPAVGRPADILPAGLAAGGGQAGEDFKRAPDARGLAPADGAVRLMIDDCRTEMVDVALGRCLGSHLRSAITGRQSSIATPAAAPGPIPCSSHRFIRLESLRGRHRGAIQRSNSRHSSHGGRPSPR